MPLTARQQTIRRRHLTASESSAVLFPSKWKGPRDVWLEKTRELEASQSSPAAEVGNRLESGVLDWFADVTGKRVSRANPLRVDKKGTVLSATHDGLIEETRQLSCGDIQRFPIEGVEAKTSGVLWYGSSDDWGDTNNDNPTGNVPISVATQCLQQAYVSDLERVWVPALIGGRGFKLYVVERDDEIIGEMVGRLTDWWEKHVVGGVEPDGDPPRIETLKRIKREPGKTVSIPFLPMQLWRTAEDLAKYHRKEADAAKREVVSLLGDAEAGECGDGSSVTYLEQSRKETVQKASTFRVLRFKEAK